MFKKLLGQFHIRALLIMLGVGMIAGVLNWGTSGTTPERIIRILPSQVTDSLPVVSVLKGVVAENQTFFEMALSLGVPPRTAEIGRAHV